MSKEKQSDDKPLTLRGLVQYNEEVLLPALDKRFEDVDKQFRGVDQHFRKAERNLEEFESDMTEFKHRSLKTQDEMLAILQKVDREQDAMGAWSTRTDKTLQDLQARVERLEQKLRFTG